jgi:hypothetical protein
MLSKKQQQELLKNQMSVKLKNVKKSLIVELKIVPTQ